MTATERYLLPAAVSVAPTIMLLLTWSDERTSLSWAVKFLALPVIASELAVIVVAIYERKRLALPWPATMAILGWSIVAWFTASVAEDRNMSLLWTGYWMIHLLFAISVANLFDPTSTVRALLAGFVLFSLVLLARAASAPVADWLNNPPGLDQIRRYAYYAAPIAGLGIGAFVRPGRSFAFFATTVAFAVIFWNGARGAVIAVFVATAIGAAAIPAMRRWPIAYLSISAALLGLAISLLLPGYLVSMGARRLATEYGSTLRVDQWAVILDAIMARPLLGWGEAQASNFIVVAQPHNLALQVLLAWGVVGFALVVFLGQFALRRVFPKVRSHEELTPAAIGALTILVYSAVDGTLFHVVPMAIFAICAGLLFTRTSGYSSPTVHQIASDDGIATSPSTK